MNDEPLAREIEDLSRQIRTPAAPSSLRDRVLSAVNRELAHELARKRRRRWDRLLTAAAGISILLGVTVNIWVARQHEQQLARFFGPAAPPRPITQWTETVSAVTGAAQARQLKSQLLDMQRRSRPTTTWQNIEAIDRLLQELAFDDSRSSRKPLSRHSS